MKLFFQAVNSLKERPWALVFFGLLIFVTLYQNFLSLDPILTIDDQAMLRAVSSNHFSEIDRQPIRDLSFHLDFLIMKIMPFWSHHASNILIFFLFIITVGLILISSQIPRWHFILVAYCFHPTFANIVPWISARKHLLSALFISLAILVVIKYGRTYRGLFLTFALFVLAILSHPIMIFWPFWLAAYFIWVFRMPFRQAFLKSAPFFIFAAILSIANFFHYENLYAQRSDLVYNLPYLKNIELIPFFFGRAFFNLFLPINLTYRYQYYSVQNLIGLAGILFFFWALFKSKTDNKTILWAALFWISFGIFLVIISHGFYFDTYGIIPSLAILIILSERFKNYLCMSWAPLFLGILTLVFMVIHTKESKRWMSEELVMENMLNRAPQPGVFRTYATMIITKANDCTVMKKAGTAIAQLSKYENGDVQRDLNVLISLFFNKMKTIKCSREDRREAVATLSLPEVNTTNLLALLYIELEDRKGLVLELEKLKIDLRDFDHRTKDQMIAQLNKACLQKFTKEENYCQEVLKIGP